MDYDAHEALADEASRRAKLTSITGRVPLHLVPPDASGCRGESCHQGRLPCRERCGAEMGGGTGDEPTAPTRRLPTKPRLSPIKRLVLMLNRWRASFF